jgi:hypothetical protein
VLPLVVALLCLLLPLAASGCYASRVCSRGFNPASGAHLFQLFLSLSFYQRVGVSREACTRTCTVCACRRTYRSVLGLITSLINLIMVYGQW